MYEEKGSSTATTLAEEEYGVGRFSSHWKGYAACKTTMSILQRICNYTRLGVSKRHGCCNGL